MSYHQKNETPQKKHMRNAHNTTKLNSKKPDSHNESHNDSRKIVHDAIKIFFELPELYFDVTNSNKILDRLTNSLTYSMHKEMMLYSIEGIYTVDEAENALYLVEYSDGETETLTINPDSNKKLTVFCDYSKIYKKETYKYPESFLKVNIDYYIFKNKYNSSLKLVIKKNSYNNIIIDAYCLLDNLGAKDISSFYNEVKEYNDLICNI
jgi:hypothetical protein